LRLQTAIALLLGLGIASYFWVGSRYPSLLKKLHTGTSIKTSGALSFDAKLPVTPQMPVATRIGRTTVNWMWTNRIGMTFSLFFGAAILTLLPLLPRRRFQSAAANTALGAITGIPLGVCANCVAPIGQSLYQGGASSSTVLATMISSPMLNVVVLTMVFPLFPPAIAALRLAIPLVVLALVPWLTRPARPGFLTPARRRQYRQRNRHRGTNTAEPIRPVPDPQPAEAVPGMADAEIREVALERRVMLAWRADLDSELLAALRDTAASHPWPGRAGVRDERLDFAR